MTKFEKNLFWQQVVQKIQPHSQLRRFWELKGGVSAQITALEIELASGQLQKMVVRQHGEIDRKQNPQIAATEYRLLEILQAVGLPAPKPYYLDQSGQVFPLPYIVIEFVEGKSEFEPSNLDEWLRKAAQLLAQIHSTEYGGLDLSFLPEQTVIYAAKFKQRPPQVDDSLDEGRIRAVLEAVWPPVQSNKAVLLHGDYWPGNLLWQASEIAAVIDWEDAQTGDPLADLANSRLEILWAFGREAMLKFSAYYKSLIALDYSNLPYWDLCAALKPAFRIGEWVGDPQTEQTMRAKHKLFVEQAFEQLDISYK